jgi:putative peptidoglycan lipid II flippase
VYILAFAAFLSSLLALVRDRLFAAHFGAGTELDLYYAAFRIPDLLFVATGALVSAYVLIPELAKRNAGAKKTYIDTIVVAFSVLAVLVSGAATFLAPIFLPLLFPQLDASGHLPTLITLTRIMLLQPIFLGLSNILAAVTQAKQRYALYAISPLLYNVGIIFGLIAFYPSFGMQGLAWGVVLGAVLHVGIQVPSIIADGYLRSLPRLSEASALFATVTVSIPRALTLAMNQVIFLGLIMLAAPLAPGSIAVFILAYNLQAVPLSIIGASYSVAAFPTLAAALARGQREEFVEHISTAARYVLFWSLPATALIVVLRAHVVRAILGSGAFDWTDTRLTAAVFALLSLSLAAQGLMLLFARGYYAAGRTFVPFFIAVGSAAMTILLAVHFLKVLDSGTILGTIESFMRLDDVPGSSILALALAYSVVSIASVITLALHFEHRFGGLFRRIRVSLWQSGLAALGGATLAHVALSVVGPLTLSSTLLSVLLRGGAGGIAGITGAALVYFILSNREYAETVSGIRSRLWRAPLSETKPITSAEEAGVSSPQ